MEHLMGGFGFLVKGGWVAYCLTFLSVILWYALGCRYFFLKSKLLKTKPKLLMDKEVLVTEDPMTEVILSIKKILLLNIKDKKMAIECERQTFINSLNVHKQTIRSIVIVAPLLGLLGTVIGMIETFESLQNAALFSQSGGIAGGISQALITTQLGLVVAIPGLLIGKKLDRKQNKMTQYVDHFLGLINLQLESSDEV